MPDADYHALREQVAAILVEARHERALADDAGKLRAYWHIGDALVRHLDARPDPGYGQNIVRNLSKDIHLGRSTLYDILRLRRLRPNVRALGRLSWGHYVVLVHLPDAEQLAHYERLAADGAWTTRQLKTAIDADRGGQLAVDAEAPLPDLRPHFGELSTYRVVADPFDPNGRPALDFGFHQTWVPAGLPGFDAARPGDVVTLRRGPGGATRAELRTDRPSLWTYAARVQRIVDGDTLAAVADLGLGHRADPRLRLRGVDTPEVYTQAGRRAKAFVVDVLSRADVVVIATRLTDIYGRYLADVKYLPGADPQTVLERGTYLNRQLLDEGLARRYEG